MKKTNKEINTNNMIALCHIVNEFDEFEKNLLTSLSSNKNFIFQMQNVLQGKCKLGAKKAKRFCEEYKSVIDTINKYSSIQIFINQNYGLHGEIKGDSRFFYEYLINHKNEIPKILELLQKLKDLGFNKLEFNEELDFTKEIYDVSPALDRNHNVTYVANPQIVPNYLDRINFKTTDSNYKIEFPLICLHLTSFIDKQICNYSKKITLNSLLFDPNTLPEKTNIEYIHGQLVRLKNEQQDKTNIIRSSVDLSISVEDLKEQFDYTYKVISELDNVKNKEELITALSIIKENLEKLKKLSIEHNDNISQNDPLLTPELLEKERDSYIKRRIMSNIDFC